MKPFYALLLLFIANSFFVKAQQESPRFSVSAELGAGHLFANSNLSPYGIHSRGEYNSGFSGNIKAGYRLGKMWKVGVKYNVFVVSENYELKDHTPIADDMELHYIAPQVGLIQQFADRIQLEYMIGAGYMYYRSKGLCDTKEMNFKKRFLGANMDFTLNYRLFRHSYIGLGTSLTSGHTSSLKVKDGSNWQTQELDKWNRLKVMRADVFLSLKVLM